MAANAPTLSDERYSDTMELDILGLVEIAGQDAGVEASLEAQIEARYPRYAVMLRLEVITGEHTGHAAVLYGQLSELAELRDELERRRILWKRHGTFGDARLQITEHFGRFIAR